MGLFRTGPGMLLLHGSKDIRNSGWELITDRARESPFPFASLGFVWKRQNANEGISGQGWRGPTHALITGTRGLRGFSRKSGHRETESTSHRLIARIGDGGFDFLFRSGFF